MTTARATRFLAVGASAAALLFAAGCGDDDKSSTTAADTAAATSTSAADTTSTTASTPADPAATPIRNPFRRPVQTAHPGARVDQLQIRDVTVGDGEEIQAGDTAIVDYYGSIYQSGRRFDSSWDAGREPLEIRIDNGGVIAGWWQGIPGMRIGGRRTLVIPPALGYGAQEQNGIPANSTLFFTVDLLGIRRATPTGATDPAAAAPAG
ncbi:FKBP-type peptidyl-prolyl cis-trans isomerase [Conexibacter sp. JD483]|uniref:FKBP-type peptidyl-prolyl cis-trans isomerase n=1 Tax=unclassified Conexibacter TaxID=2627773 RepID=UPI00272819B0|nr:MULTISPECIES: FKBP-type peptidyl-prolyl cis-trans isomerase [unclassified Conexibacter]MDO8184713.1 FKBP-type peptidyl-prolyl cis-trans isomerase [Conexibacter sp. CPCC 205706]MDO8198019.1 FKBP-type peptidyl-prolyl cis-trans isomerase [Conexibacter sp. CPCC 205762]MDR9372316.1 FKBP-type peptidyl-prolyl cis-trans isomerase [Conexibacter sp. JD483]